MREIIETCRYCYWSAILRNGEFVCNRKLGTTERSISVDPEDFCENWLDDHSF